jgi:tRNA A-37 threonylcarbamoyl transferase component Bud32/RecA/RadA recombinase
MTTINDRFALMGEPIRGGMSIIFKAVDLKDDGKLVAVKIYAARPIDDSVLSESFRRERLALRELKHPNIVTIIDEGFQEDHRKYYVVLEWLAESLADRLKKAGSGSWPSVYRDFGRPVLDALSFAHNRSYVHRDVKSDNIMFASRGEPRLIDFGLSKLRRYIMPGVTLSAYVSEPFAPPEPDDGSSGYSRDTYGLCMTMLDALRGGGTSTRSGALETLASARLPTSVAEILAKGISEDPAERYGNADELLADLDTAESRRITLTPVRPECYVQFTTKPTAVLKEHFNVTTEDAAWSLFADDVNGACGVKAYESAREDGDTHFILFGAELSYHVKIEPRLGDRLIVLSASVVSPAKLERSRDFSCPAQVRFRVGTPLGTAAARSTLIDLETRVREHLAAQSAAESAMGAERLFEVWSGILDAKYQHEADQQNPLAYSARSVDGRSVTFRLKASPQSVEPGERRAFQAEDRTILSGEVTQVDTLNKEVTILVSNGEPDLDIVPPEGQLVVDRNSNKVPLDRQRKALEAVRVGAKDTVRSDLGMLVAHPERIRSPAACEVPEFLQDLDADKREAVVRALGVEDFLLIEGPPGTGKTTVIAEIVLQTLRRNPNARILLTSQTHIALDNAIEKIDDISRRGDKEVSIVRLGRADDERIAVDARRHLLHERMEGWKREALARSNAFLEAWAEERGIERRDVEIGMLLEEVLGLKRRIIDADAEELKLRPLTEQPEAVAEARTGRVDADILDPGRLARQELARVKAKRGEAHREIEVRRARLAAFGDYEATLPDESLEELSDYLSVYDSGRPEVAALRNLIVLQADWKLRFGRGADFEAALLTASDLVAGTCIGVLAPGASDVEYDLCILDEASKATATEAIVPLSRARRWILVGDLQQLPPFQDEALRDDRLLERFGLAREDLRVTLFSHLLRNAPEGARVKLASQRRMIRPIGDLVSRCFYDGELETKREERDDRLSEFLGRPIVWVSTSGLPRRQQENVGESIRNDAEVGQVVRKLKAINNFAASRGVRYKVCVLTPYGAQVSALRRRIEPEVPRWAALDVEIGTVDAYQGRESDIAILSFVRSDKGRRIGFLRESERLNVALSRARLALVLIGDKDFLKRADEPNPFRRVIGHIEATPVDCRVEEARP